MKFKNGDKVRVIDIAEEYKDCLNAIGVVVDVDPDWGYPYEVVFEDKELREAQEIGQMQELFAEDEIEHWGKAVIMLPVIDKLKNEKIENSFKYHAPKDGQAEKYEAIRERAKGLAYLIDELCPDSREKSVAMTELETCVMWANASIARNG